MRKRERWHGLNGHVKRKRRNSQAGAYCCARRISTRQTRRSPENTNFTLKPGESPVYSKTLDRQLSVGAPRTRCDSRRTPSCSVDTILRRVLSGGSPAPRLTQGRTGSQMGRSPTYAHSQGRRAPSRWGTPSSLRVARGRVIEATRSGTRHRLRRKSTGVTARFDRAEPADE